MEMKGTKKNKRNGSFFSCRWIENCRPEPVVFPSFVLLLRFAFDWLILVVVGVVVAVASKWETKLEVASTRVAFSRAHQSCSFHFHQHSIFRLEKKKETLHFVIPDEWWQWPVEQPVKNNQWTIVCLYFWNDGSGEWGTAVAAAQLQPPGRLFQQRLFQQRAPETGG